MVRKLDQYEEQIVRLIADAGGTYAPEPNEIGAVAKDALHSLVKKSRLDAEDIDGLTRYTLTSLGWDDSHG